MIEPAIRKEAEDLVNALEENNDGAVTMEEWKTVFGSIFDKKQALKAGGGGAKPAAAGTPPKPAAPKAPKAAAPKKKAAPAAKP